MNTYMMTFNQRSGHKNGWIEVLASDLSAVTDFAEENYGGEWCHVYTQSEFNPQFFPEGCLDTVELD